MAKNKEEKSAYQKEWYQKNRERRSQYKKEYNKRTKEMRAEKNKEYYQKTKEQKALYRKKYFAENKLVLAEKNKIYRENNKQAILKAAQEYGKTCSGRFIKIKSSAKSRNIYFDLTLDKYEELFYNKPCFYCESVSMGIDRINSQLGYIDGNMVPCCFDCNKMKLDKTLEEFENHIIKIHKIILKKRNMGGENE